MPTKRAGKSFESQFGRALEKSLGAWSHNSNNPIPACDYVAGVPVRCLRLSGGWDVIALACLLECKECASVDGRFSIPGNISDNERKLLTSFPASGLAAVIIKDTRSKTWDYRYFGMRWPDWLAHEREIGFDPVVTGRRRAGTCTLSLNDGERPARMFEIFEIPRGNLGPTLDLTPLLPAGLELAK